MRCTHTSHTRTPGTFVFLLVLSNNVICNCDLQCSTGRLHTSLTTHASNLKSVFFLQAQYEFIYDTVSMYLQCGITVITARELPAVVQKLAVKDPQTRLNGFEREYKVKAHCHGCSLLRTHDRGTGHTLGPTRYL